MLWHAYTLLVLAPIFSVENTVGDDQSLMVHCIDEFHDETACTRGCKPGYLGAFCNETCSEHCGGACSQDTGHCLTGCKPNWFTSNCSQPCSGNCVDDVCDRKSAECIRGCKDGFYGLNCNETCSANCTDGKCDIYGGCHCETGVLDKFCYIDCTDNCIGGACAVDNDGQLKCLQGCKEGRMGLFCNEWCPYNCPACNISCLPRVMKRRTERETPNNCFENNTCKDGYRGPQCDISCPACRYDRHCNLSCAGGSWGEECHFECPQHCSRASFDGRSLCDFENGLCKSGCLQGYFGYKCKHICPDTCHKNYCYLNNGSCTWGCDPEHWGPSCENRCGKCKDMKCERNGSCTCIEGYYGPRCEVECSNRCKGNCSITMNGSHICETECITGFTGVDCQARCPSDCSRGCNREDGTCAGTPKTPLDFKALKSNKDSVTLTWTPLNAGRDNTQKFHVEYRIQRLSDDWSIRVFTLSQGNSGFGVVDGLQPNTGYVFRIKSVTDMTIGNHQSPVSEEIYFPTKGVPSTRKYSGSPRIEGGVIAAISFSILCFIIAIGVTVSWIKKKLCFVSKSLPRIYFLCVKRKNEDQADSSNPPGENIEERSELLNPPPGNHDKQSDSSISPQGKIDKLSSTSNCSQENIDEQTNSSICPKGTESSIYLENDTDPSSNGKNKNEELKVHLPNEGKDDQHHTEPARQREVTGSIIVERGLIAEESEYLLGPAPAGSASKDGRD